MRTWCATLLLALAAACGGGGGGPDAGAPLVAGTRSQSTIHSLETGITYNYQVYLPPGYAQSTTRYPVIYAADAEERFTRLSNVLESQRRNAILVDVGHMGGDRRWIDFTMPGAAAYYRFLTQELIPSIDAMYRTDPAHRTYSGHSLSGEFAVYALYMEVPGQRFFRALISADGSFWARPDRLFEDALAGEPAATMERAMFEHDRNVAVDLVLGGDSQGNAPRVIALHNYLGQRGYANLRLRSHLSSIGHTASDVPTFEDALAFIFGPPVSLAVD